MLRHLAPGLLIIAVILFHGCHLFGEDDGGAAEPLAAPAVKAITSGNGKVVVEWERVADAVKYTVYWDTVPGVTLLSNPLPEITANKLEHGGLSNGVTYYYRVSAQNKEGIGSALSEEMSAMPEGDSLDAPVIKSISLKGNSVEVTWDKVNGASQYTLYWSNDSGVTDKSTHIADIKTLAHNHTGLQYGKTYYYRVAAADAAGKTSPLSREKSATPEFTFYLSAKPDSARVTLSWKPAENAKQYILYWGNTAGVDDQSSKIDGITKTTYEHSELENGKTYYYRAQVEFNYGLFSELSKEIKAIPEPPKGQDLSGSCTDGKSMEQDGKKYVCKGGKWVDTSGTKSCTEGEVYEGKGSKWICTGGQWVEQ